MRSKAGRLGRAGAVLLLVFGLASLIAPVLQAVTSAPAGAATNLIQNGSFEQPALGGPSYFQIYSGGSTAITNWTVGGNSVAVETGLYYAPEDGLQSVDLAGNAAGSLAQSLTDTSVGQSYTLSWYMAGNPTCASDPDPVKTMDVSWDGTLVSSPSFNTAGHSSTSVGWVEEQVQVTGTGSDTVEFADATAGGGTDPCGAVLDNVTLAPTDTSDCSSASGFSDDFASDTALSDCWETAVPNAALVNNATFMAPQLTFNGTDMDMQGAAAEPEFTGIESDASYQAPFDFTATVKAIQSGDSSFVIYLANQSGGGISLEANLSPSAFNGIWAAEAGGYLGAQSDIDSSISGQSFLSNQPLGTTFHIGISMDTDAHFQITVNGTTISSASLGQIGNGPFRVILGQRESDNEAIGSPPPGPTGPNEAGWYSAGLTETYCSSSAFNTNFEDEFATGGPSGVYDGDTGSCWLAEQGSYEIGTPPAIASAEEAGGFTDVAPSLDFPGFSSPFSPLAMTGTFGGQANAEFTGIQSGDAYSAPFELQTSVEGLQSYGSAFSIFLLSPTGDMSLEGDLESIRRVRSRHVGERVARFAADTGRLLDGHARALAQRSQ